MQSTAKCYNSNTSVKHINKSNGSINTHSHKNTWKNPLRLFRNPSGKSVNKKHWEKLSANVMYNRHQCLHQSNMPVFSIENTGSSILESAEILQLWKWLPVRWQILEWESVYSTNIHGCRLMTLYDKTEYYESTIIIIKTSDNCVFGAFCPVPLSNRLNKQKSYSIAAFFGTGETFLFKLRPIMEKYEWVGIELQGETDRSQELYMYADNKSLIIGSGGEGSGLEIDENLAHGTSRKCDTFSNEPLCAGTAFEIQVLEVLSFKSAGT